MNQMTQKLTAKNPDRQEEMEEYLRSEEHFREQRGSPARYNIIGPRGKGRYYVTAIVPGVIQCISCQQDLKLGERITLDGAQASHYTCPEVES